MRTKLVFLGKVIRIRNRYIFGIGDFPTFIRFRVEKQWKGKAATEIEVPMARGLPGMCGDFSFSVGRQ